MDSAIAGPAGNKRPYAASNETHESSKDSSPLSSQHHQHSWVSPNHVHSTHNALPQSPIETSPAAFSAFRNVSACNRCRLRKNRCDTRLPRCSACERAKVKCTGYDPVYKREIPRSYVYWLESRVSYFESLLVEHGIAFKPPEAFDIDLPSDHGSGHSPVLERNTSLNGGSRDETAVEDHTAQNNQAQNKEQDEKDKLNKLVSDVGMVSVQGASDPRWLGSTSGIPFARVVFAAVKSSMSANTSEKSSVRASRPMNGVPAGNSMRDSAFRLHALPTTSQAPFPTKDLGEGLMNLYFEHANPQIPILHRDEFKEHIFNKAYPEEQRKHLARRELYMLNMVFAIGAGIIYGSSDQEAESELKQEARDSSSPSSKRLKLAHRQQQPEEYHAAAMAHLDSILGPSSVFDRTDGLGGGLEELQALLLLASFALLRPVTPGLWHIVGFAVRLALELGLHTENGTNLDGITEERDAQPSDSNTSLDATHLHQNHHTSNLRPSEKGRREWIRDLRRRLFWSTYSLDRLVSTCVGRPIGIPDQAVTTEFLSVLDDQYITPSGFLEPPAKDLPSYKLVSYHYLRLRLLQSEILQVLQYREARQARYAGRNSTRFCTAIDLPLPFLEPFESFRGWRKDIDHRLWEWKCAAPNQEQTGVQFHPLFLELNYWQAMIMLYRQSLAVPAQLASVSTPVDDLASPSLSTIEEKDEADEVYLKVAEAGQQILRLYRILHRVKLVNYTYLSTHHLFMAGISFLYALWHSPLVRSRLTADDVDFTVLSATSVLGDLTEKCPPAEACKAAFERMSKATVQMCLSTTGLGSQVNTDNKSSDQQSYAQPTRTTSVDSDSFRYPHRQASFERQPGPSAKPRRPPPRFDMGFKDLFPDDISQYDLPSQSFSNSLLSRQQSQQHYRPQNHAPQHDLPPHYQETTSSGSQPFLSQTQFPTTHHVTHASPPAITASQQAPRQPPLSALDTSMSQTNPYTQPQPQTAASTSFFNPSDFSNLPDMSFLDTFGGGPNDSDNFGDSMNGFGGGTGTAVNGIDLGFGMNMDLQHDWSEGNQFDLLDGFFFGGGVGAGAGNGGAAGSGAAYGSASGSGMGSGEGSA